MNPAFNWVVWLIALGLWAAVGAVVWWGLGL